MFHEQIITWIPTIVGVGLAWLVARQAVKLMSSTHKSVQIQGLFKELGLGNFRLKDLNELNPQGWDRFIQLIAIVRSSGNKSDMSSAAKSLQDILQVVQVAQAAGPQGGLVEK